MGSLLIQLWEFHYKPWQTHIKHSQMVSYYNYSAYKTHFPYRSALIFTIKHGDLRVMLVMAEYKHPPSLFPQRHWLNNTGVGKCRLAVVGTRNTVNKVIIIIIIWMSFSICTTVSYLCLPLYMVHKGFIGRYSRNELR